MKITYDVETGGAIEKRELPFIVGIFADLAGDRDPEVAPTPMKLRRMVDIDRDVFNDVMKTIRPRVALGPILAADKDAGGTLADLHDGSVSELIFGSIDDFGPLQLVMALPPFKARYLARGHLRGLQAKAESNDDISAHLDAWVHGADPATADLAELNRRQAELIKALAGKLSEDQRRSLRMALYQLQGIILTYQQTRKDLPLSDSVADKKLRTTFQGVAAANAKAAAAAETADADAVAVNAAAVKLAKSTTAVTNAQGTVDDAAKTLADAAAADKPAAKTKKDDADKALADAKADLKRDTDANTKSATDAAASVKARDTAKQEAKAALDATAADTSPAANALRAWDAIIAEFTSWIMLDEALGPPDPAKPADLARVDTIVGFSATLVGELAAPDTPANRDLAAALAATLQGADAGNAATLAQLGAASADVLRLAGLQTDHSAPTGHPGVQAALLLLGLFNDAKCANPPVDAPAPVLDDDAQARQQVRDGTLALAQYLHQPTTADNAWAATEIFVMLDMLDVSSTVAAAKAILRLRHFADQVLRKLQAKDPSMQAALKRGANALIDETVVMIDKGLSSALSTLMHAPSFTQVEATWRGLHYLVSNTETSTMLRLRVFNATVDDLRNDMAKAVEFDQSVLFKMIYEAEYGSYGGFPYSLLVGGYEIGGGSADIEFLTKISEVAAAAHAPFIAAAKSDLFGLSGFDKLDKPRDLAKIFEGAELIGWQEFRQTEDARYVSLVLPRALLRLPYGRPDQRYTQQCEGLNFDENVAEDGSAAVMTADGSVQSYPKPGSQNFLWGNPAYLLAQRITHAFSLFNWTAAIRGVEGGGLVDGLPVYSYTSDAGSTELFCPVEIAITDRREKELNDLGFISLCHCKGTGHAAFFGGQTTNLPKKYFSDSANANAKISAMLPYMLAASRFAHYIKVIMRDKIGSFMTRANVEIFLNSWIANYVLLDDNASQDQKSAYPLRDASVVVTEVPGSPGAYRATVFLKPHFQLEELTTSIRLVANLPA